MYRLSFTITTFPFTDPSPNNNLHGRLLGIRLDHCSRSGTFQKPYYILLRRLEEGGDEWRVHRHTIPAFVPLRRLEDEFLPVRDENEDMAAAEGLSAKKQDLHGFVRKIRHELICWEMRREAIGLLKDELGLLPEADGDMDDDEEEMEDTNSSAQSPRGRYGIQSIEPTTFETRQARIIWTDGTIARIKISTRGLVERAVVVGENGRIRGVENLLVDGESRIEELVGKLKVLVGETE
jgi:central kinetochore subunit Mal2/MCM21